MSKGYFVRDMQFPIGQHGSYLSPQTWGAFKSVKEIANVIRSYSDFYDSCQDTGDIDRLDALPDYQILELWDWNSGEILATDILDFANAHWRVLSGLI